MSAGALSTSVRFQPRRGVGDGSENGSTSLIVDEGAILLENQVQTPDDGQNMASSSTEQTNNKMQDGTSIVDMVMIYEVPDPSSLDDEEEQQEEDDKKKIREFYIDGLKTAGLLVEVDTAVSYQSEDAEVPYILIYIHVVFVSFCPYSQVKCTTVCMYV